MDPMGHSSRELKVVVFPTKMVIVIILSGLESRGEHPNRYMIYHHIVIPFF